MRCRETGCGFESRALRFLMTDLALKNLSEGPSVVGYQPSVRQCRKMTRAGFIMPAAIGHLVRRQTSI
jgi:hypothetical protein